MSSNPIAAAEQPALSVSEPTGMPSFAMRWYILLVLMVIMILSNLDRQIMAVLAEPIRKEFGLNDTQLGLLNGLAFSLPFTLACIPIARLADRFSRRKMLAGMVAFWSLTTIACGSAQNFFQLLLGRGAVGVGESGQGAAAPAFIGDIFPPLQRSTAASVYLLGAPIGLGLALAFGAWAAANFGWRTAFLMAGLPGILLAILVLFTVPDVRKGAADGVKHDIQQRPLWETLVTLWKIRSLMAVIIGNSVLAMLSMGLAAWTPTFLIRSHDMSPLAAGASLGAAMATGQIIGYFAGGPLTDWLARWDRRVYIWLPITTTILSTTLGLFIYLGPVATVVPLIGLQFFVTGLFVAPQLVIKMTLPPIAARATLAALGLVLMNLIALGIGPLLVGAISDALAPTYGTESLRYALLSMFVLSVPALGLYLIANRHFAADWDRAVSRSSSDA